MRLKAAPARLGTAPSRLTFGDTDERSLDRKRKAMDPARNWYNLKAWSDLRIATFVRDLFTCRMCGKIDGKTSRLVCDHIKPHRGNRALFFDPNNLQTLCKPCHDGAKQRSEQSSRR